MQLILYNTESPHNTINKVKHEVTSYNIILRKDTAISRIEIPLVERTIDLTQGVNYAYIEGLDRYYFIVDVEVRTANLFVLTLEIDVLESFKDDILDSYGTIIESDNPDYAVGIIEQDSRKEIEIYESNRSLDGKNEIIMNVVRE